jgi:hypothetical protein
MTLPVLAAIALGAMAAGTVGAEAPVAPSAPLRPVVLISIDGLKPEYLRQADSLGLRIPTLRQLMRSGASARGVRGVLPTLTYPSHATLVSGVSPARHGIEANTTFDPLQRNQSGWYWYAEDIRVSTLWDAVQAKGGTVAAVHWPVNVGARITWNVPQIWRTGMPDDRKLVRALGTPGLLDSLERRVGLPYPDGIDEGVMADEARARFVAQLLAWKRPTLTLAYLTAFDHEQHQAGPWSRPAFDVLERVDAAVDTIVSAARRTFGSGVTIAVVSDHGFSASHSEVHLAIPFVEAGLLQLGPDGRPAAWRAALWPAGGSVGVMLADTSAALRDSVRALLDRTAADSTAGIASVAMTGLSEAPEGFASAGFVVAFKPGYRIGYGLRGPLRTAAAGGMHGYPPDDPLMLATFLVTGAAVQARRELGRIDMRDIAPTLAMLLGVHLPQAEGRVLPLGDN